MSYPNDGLTINEAQMVNDHRAAIWHPNGIYSWSGPEWFTALAGEIGELGGAIKETIRNRDALPGKGLDEVELKSQIANEIADVFAYLMLIASYYNIDLATAHCQKFNEVTSKHGFDDPSKYEKPIQKLYPRY